MQPKISRTLFSNLLRKFSHFPKPPITEECARFSSIPNRPMRGGNANAYANNNRRRREHDSSNNTRNSSEENFLRNLNFRDPGNAPNTHQNPRPQSPNRPVGGTDKFNKSLRLNEKDEELISGDKKEERLSDALFEKLDFDDKVGGKTAVEEEPETSPPPPEDAEEIFKKMKETGLIPNAVAMLDGLCKDGLVQDAMKLFGLMREKGSIPEVVIYTAVVEGFCKAGKFDDAKRIFKKMQKNGIVPNAFSYGLVIQGLSKGRRLEDAVEFCVEMLESGHSPNAATLTGVVSGFCEEKGVEEAEGFLRGLREKGFVIDEKGVREYLDKKGPYSPMVWEAIFGKKKSQRLF